MLLSEDIIACAKLVERADPDRFRAVMVAPVAAREKLFPLYAFNVEVTRAAWITSEPTIAMMRLQWWRDILAEIRAGEEVRRHEVATPLAKIISAPESLLLDDLIIARHWDIERAPFADQKALQTYIQQTAGNLMQVACGVLGGGTKDLAEQAGYAQGVAAFLLAVPALKAAGRRPLPDESLSFIRTQAKDGLRSLDIVRSQHLPKTIRPALLSAWKARSCLNAILKNPESVLSGGVKISPLRAQWLLMRQMMTGKL